MRLNLRVAGSTVAGKLVELCLRGPKIATFNLYGHKSSKARQLTAGNSGLSQHECSSTNLPHSAPTWQRSGGQRRCHKRFPETHKTPGKASFAHKCSPSTQPFPPISVAHSHSRPHSATCATLCDSATGLLTSDCGEASIASRRSPSMWLQPLCNVASRFELGSWCSKYKLSERTVNTPK